MPFIVHDHLVLWLIKFVFKDKPESRAVTLKLPNEARNMQAGRQWLDYEGTLFLIATYTRIASCAIIIVEPVVSDGVFCAVSRGVQFQSNAL